MTYAPVSDVLKGQLAVDSEVTVRGWIRSRRDSKAGISFLAIYDPYPIQAVQAVDQLSFSLARFQSVTIGQKVARAQSFLRPPSA